MIADRASVEELFPIHLNSFQADIGLFISCECVSCDFQQSDDFLCHEGASEVLSPEEEDVPDERFVESHHNDVEAFVGFLNESALYRDQS